MSKKASAEQKKSPWAAKEEEILEFWKEHRIFEKSLSKESPKGEFVFYEGPPTANGRPGIHHLESRAFKDAIPRYKTMRGFHVRRKAGWDTHGLPVELEVEKELGLSSKKEIEEYGIAKFNDKCKESVWKYVDEWRAFTERSAYWVDLDDAYVTYKPEYIESLWSIVSGVNNRGLLYKDYRVVPWCPRCGTALSSHELAQGYKDVEDISVYVKFKLKPGQKIRGRETDGNTYILAWTTTSWTLPGNVGLAVKNDVAYSVVECEGARYVVASDLAEKLLESSKEIWNVFGSDLVGLEYEPLFPFLAGLVEGEEQEKLERNGYRVYPADFVSTEDGTGIVHTAVMYGQDDFELGTEHNLPKHHLVQPDGTFIAEAGELAGKHVDDVGDEIIEMLGDAVYRREKVPHTYPFCWRCKSRLIYYARDSWYIRMSEVRDELVKENSEINWEPAHIRDGRFGEWLRDVKDWAISRERYWGTPLPVWQEEESGELLVVDSLETLKAYTRKSGNMYFVMRHGEAESNVQGIVSSEPDNPHHLTARGKRQVDEAIGALETKKIDCIIASPFVRTRETAERVGDALGIARDDIIFDERIREVRAGDFNGKPVDEFHAYFDSLEECFTKQCPHGEDYTELKNRTAAFLYDLESRYNNKKILIVSHDAPLWTMFAGAVGATAEGAAHMRREGFFINNAEVRELPFVQLPHNEKYELDLHRPFVDDVELVDTEGRRYRRMPEVMDVWFDSGGMPFAQDHYPMENKEWIDDDGFPADYISEAIDQTRGWFYTLHAIGVLVGRGKAYKNVISLGHLLDAEGKKMSKSVGNVVDPWEMIERYGVDALRFWMYSVNQPGESKNFDERTVDEILKKVFNLLLNVVKFYELYADGSVATSRESAHVLDRWVLARLDTLVEDSTRNLDAYNLLEPARDIREFIADLSQWYIRRSRERFKSDDVEDTQDALATTRYVLRELSKVMAPFIPFMAEEIFQKVRDEKDAPSVHLDAWPEAAAVDKKILENMARVRKLVSLGLEQRARFMIKVRQPLSEFTVAGEEFSEDFTQLIAEEVNVKKVSYRKGEEVDAASLNTAITLELKAEGNARELVRQIQDLRKKNGLTPGDTPTLLVETSEAGQKLVSDFRDEITHAALLASISFEKAEGEAITIDGVQFTLGLKT